jgi:hypothetical protein
LDGYYVNHVYESLSTALTPSRKLENNVRSRRWTTSTANSSSKVLMVMMEEMRLLTGVEMNEINEALD